MKLAVNRKQVNRTIKYLLYAIELILLYVVQTSPNFVPKILGATPSLILVAAITIALVEDEMTALYTGLFAGILIDFSYGNHLGLFAIIMTILCCAIRVFIQYKLKATLKSSIITGLVSLFVAVCLDWIFRYCVAGFSSVSLVFIDKYLPVYLYSALCLPIVYLINFGVYTGTSYIKFEKNKSV